MVFAEGANPNNPSTWLVQTITRTPEGYFLNWNTQPGAVYQVQTTSSDTQAWTNVGALRFAPGTTDSIYLGYSTLSYYRVMRWRFIWAFMFRAFKRFLLVPALWLWGGCSVFGFSLAGPVGGTDTITTVENYQTPVLGYGLGAPNFGVDVVAPKNLGEQYRWNTKTVYYACDASFLTYFGTNGLAAVDAAFAILNGLSNVDAYSPGLTEWPLQSSRINYTAAQVNELDLKSLVLIELMEQLGLAEPDRYTYCLRDRDTSPPAVCPNYTYNVIERNYDPVTQNYSTYVNGVLYTFEIIETCADTPNPDAPLISDAFRIDVDPVQQSEGLSAVAAGQFSITTSGDPTILGRYYLGLTRDDIGGLRYLWSTNTVDNEQVEPDSLLQSPPTEPSLLVTSNLAVLQNAELTNNQAALQALFPQLQITSVTSLGVTLVPVTNFVPVTNQCAPGSVIGCEPTTNMEPVVTSVPFSTFSYTFGNVITNFTYTNNGVLTTNSPNEYLLVPSNQCGFQILFNALTGVVTTTNTNTQAVTTFTDHSLVVNVFSCTANTLGPA